MLGIVKTDPVKFNLRHLIYGSHKVLNINLGTIAEVCKRDGITGCDFIAACSHALVADAHAVNSWFGNVDGGKQTYGPTLQFIFENLGWEDERVVKCLVGWYRNAGIAVACIQQYFRWSDLRLLEAARKAGLEMVTREVLHEGASELQQLANITHSFIMDDPVVETA